MTILVFSLHAVGSPKLTDSHYMYNTHIKHRTIDQVKF